MTDDVIKGYVVKLKNRRVWLGKALDGGFHVGFRRLGCKVEGEARIVETKINLSAEAMHTLVSTYMEHYWREKP